MQPSTLDLLSILLPSGTQTLSLLGLLTVALGFVIIGAAVGGKDRIREADLLVGWAITTALMTLCGRLTPLPLSVIACVAGLAVAVAAIILWRRHEAPLTRGDLWLLAALVPLFAVTASMLPSQWDEFTQWLPNARYFVVVDAFPGPGMVPSDSVFPAYPPAIPLVPYLSSLLSSSFAEGVMPWFNLLLLASLGRLAIRLYRQDDTISPASAAWGILAVTALATTFVPKLVLSTYADTATAVTLAFSAILGLHLIGGKTTKRGEAIQFAALFALLPMTKQGNFALMGLLLCGLVVESWRLKQLTRLPKFLPLLVPTVLLILTWRSGIVAGVGELSIRPPSEWEWNLLPNILESMAEVMAAKGGYFGLALVLTVLACWHWKKDEWALARLFTVVFLGYNAFLLFVYLAVLNSYESANAASYWRYNTHVGALETLAAVAAAGIAWRCYGAGHRTLPKMLAALGIAAVIVGPLLTIKYLRFDRQPVKVHIRTVAAEMAPLLPPDAKLTVVDPRGTGFYAIYVDYLLGFGRQVDLSINVFGAKNTLDHLLPEAEKYLWVHTQNSKSAAAIGLPLATNASHLLAADGDHWRVVHSWPFPGYEDPTAVKD